MKIISWNINGIRAINGKGFLGWLEKSGGDVVCPQDFAQGVRKMYDEVNAKMREK